jgi:hypothetical protein
MTRARAKLKSDPTVAMPVVLPAAWVMLLNARAQEEGRSRSAVVRALIARGIFLGPTESALKDTDEGNPVKKP